MVGELLNNRRLVRGSKGVKVKMGKVCWGVVLFGEGKEELRELRDGGVMGFSREGRVVDLEVKVLL